MEVTYKSTLSTQGTSMSAGKRERKLLTGTPPVPEAWIGLGLAPSQESPRGPVTTPILQLRDVKVREAASQGRQLKREPGQDPLLRQSLCHPLRAQHMQGLKSTLGTRLRRSEVKVARLCPTLCEPMDYTVHGIL